MAQPVAAFFKDAGFSCCISVFDDRRGQKEGSEYEKVLCFYPTTATITVRNSIVGLAQALSTFSSSFCQVGAPGHGAPAGNGGKWCWCQAAIASL